MSSLAKYGFGPKAISSTFNDTSDAPSKIITPEFKQGNPQTSTTNESMAGDNQYNHISPMNLEDIVSQDDDEEDGYKTDGDNISNVKKIKKSRNSKCTKFSSSWLSVPEFKDWLQKSNIKTTHNSDVAFCKLCNVNLTSHKSNLIEHSKTEKHKRNERKVEHTNKLPLMLKNKTSLTEKLVSRAEIKLTGILATKNLPFLLMDDLSTLCHDIFPDSEIAKNMAIKRTKSTKIMKDCLGETFKSHLYDSLREPACFFSLIVDETTDISVKKQCAFTVIYFCGLSNTVKTKFFDMLESSSGTADHLYELLKNVILEKKIPFQNLVGFSSDTTNAMFGEHHSVVSLLKQDAPDICAIKCSCHMIHLCASKACLKLPRSVEDLLRNLGSHFNRSSIRQKRFQEFQQFFGTDLHKILKSSNTRWLSLKACVDRTLEQFEPLKAYLREAVFEDPSKTTEEMLLTMENRFTKIYLEFMSYTLEMLNDFNLLFQTESPLLYKLKPETQRLLKNLYLNFVDMSFVRKNSNKLTLADCHYHFLPLEKVYLGVAASTSITDLRTNNVPESDIKSFLLSCLNFYTELVAEITNKFKFDDPIFELISVVDPIQAQNFEIKSLAPVCDRFPVLKNFLNIQHLDNEWRDHALLDYDNFDLSGNLPAEDYWKKVFELKNAVGSCIFPNLKVVMSLLLVLPFANVSVERIFSDLKLIKTDQRNLLNTNTISSLIFTKQGINDQGGILKFEPTEKMFKLKTSVWKK